MGSLDLTTNILVIIGKKAACLTVKAAARHQAPVLACPAQAC